MPKVRRVVPMRNTHQLISSQHRKMVLLMATPTLGSNISLVGDSKGGGICRYVENEAVVVGIDSNKGYIQLAYHRTDIAEV